MLHSSGPQAWGARLCELLEPFWKLNQSIPPWTSDFLVLTAWVVQPSFYTGLQIFYIIRQQLGYQARWVDLTSPASIWKPWVVQPWALPGKCLPCENLSFIAIWSQKRGLLCLEWELQASKGVGESRSLHSNGEDTSSISPSCLPRILASPSKEMCWTMLCFVWVEKFLVLKFLSSVDHLSLTTPLRLSLLLWIMYIVVP